MSYSEVQKNVIKELEFLSFREELGRKYGVQDRDTSKVDPEKVKAILLELGYTTKYTKSEDFFSIIEKEAPFEFKFQIALKWKILECSWITFYNKSRIEYSGPWNTIAMELLGKHIPVPMPTFKDYEELKELLEIILAKYKLYKSNFLAAAASVNP